MSQIITVQLGQYANFIGSHFWNIQESNFTYSSQLDAVGVANINHDILFREGQTLQRETTYTPRLVSVDLKGGLGSLSQRGTLYSNPSKSDVTWSGSVEVHKQEKIQKNRFLSDLEEAESRYLGKPSADDSEKDVCSSDTASEQPTTFDLDNSVTVWTDYLRPHFHPRSVLTTKEYEFENETNPFDIHGCGIAEWNKTELGDEIMDSLRFYAEECDSLEGFNLSFDPYNGFSGIAAKTQEYLDEEYSSKVIHSFPVIPSTFPSDTYKSVNARLINLALSFSSAHSHSSVFTPLTLSESYKKSGGKPIENLNYKDYLNYHTSALLAAGLDTITLPYRLRNDSKRMSDVAELYGFAGRKLSVLGLKCPLGMMESETAIEFYGRNSGMDFTMLAPSCGGEGVTAQGVVLRGMPDSRLKRSGTVSSASRLGLIGSKTLKEATEISLCGRFPRTVNVVDVFSDPLKTAVPFPQFFGQFITSTGFVSTQKQSHRGVSSLPLMTCLQSGDACKATMDALLQDVTKIKIKRFSRFLEMGLEEEDWTDCVERLSSCRYAFEDSEE